MADEDVSEPDLDLDIDPADDSSAVQLRPPDVLFWRLLGELDTGFRARAAPALLHRRPLPDDVRADSQRALATHPGGRAPPDDVP